jgi:hypothetical protein
MTDLSKADCIEAGKRPSPASGNCLVDSHYQALPPLVCEQSITGDDRLAVVNRLALFLSSLDAERAGTSKAHRKGEVGERVQRSRCRLGQLQSATRARVWPTRTRGLLRLPRSIAEVSAFARPWRAPNPAGRLRHAGDISSASAVKCELLHRRQKKNLPCLSVSSGTCRCANSGSHRSERPGNVDLLRGCH